MKQVVQNYRTGLLKVEEFPPPTVRPVELAVANRCSLISAGTERSTVEIAKKSLAGKAMERPDLARKVMAAVRKNGLMETLKLVFERLDSPAALGYSCAGTVLSVGDQAGGFSVGERVACAGQNYASHAGIVAVPKNLCVSIPAGVDFEEAAFVALGAISLQGVRQAELHLGDRVAVIGLGLLGQLTVQLLKASGCLVLASDIAPAKLELAKTFGADMVAPPELLPAAAESFTQRRGVDAVLITASTKENGPVEVAGEISRQKGRVVVVGAVGMSLPREPYYRKELDLRFSTSYGPGRYDGQYEEKGHDYPYGYVRWTEQRNMEAFLALIGQGKVDVKRLITHRYPIDQAEQAYELMLENREPYLGIVISYPHAAATIGRRIEVRRHSNVASLASPGRLNLAIVGAGNHVKDRLLPPLRSLDGVRVHAICTNSGAHAKALAEKTGAAYCTTDFREVMHDSSVHAVLIGTRHDLHGPLVLAALEAGKHVFVEKPLCLTEEELDGITALYAEKAQDGVHLMVGFNRRFSPHAGKALAFFRDRRNPLVMVYRVNAGFLPPEHWIQDPEVGGGRIVGEACHFVDYMQFLCGAPPVSVQARRIGRHDSGIMDDQSILSFTFGDGSIGTVIYAAGGDGGPAKERFEVFGDGKSLIMDDFIRSEFYAGGRKSVFTSRTRDKGFQAEMARFVGALVEGAEPAIPFGEIQAVTRACLLAVNSLQTGQNYVVS
jgi:predicted dehydrogenase